MLNNGLIADWPGLVAALLTGLLGSGHCLAMCGGVSGALQLAVPAERAKLPFNLVFSAGRLSGYVLLALLASLLSTAVLHLAGGNFGFGLLRVIGAIFLVLMAGYIGRWWLLLARFETLGQRLFNPIKGLAKRFMPLRNLRQAFMVGMAWGWLPCGLVYSALAYSASAGDIGSSMLRMLAFGLGTLPAITTLGLAGGFYARLMKQPRTRQLAALSLLLIAAWSLYPLWMKLLLA